jgi:hypothetical protein
MDNKEVFKRLCGYEYFKNLFNEAKTSDEARVMLCGIASGLRNSDIYTREQKADAYDNLVYAYQFRQKELTDKRG